MPNVLVQDTSSPPGTEVNYGLASPPETVTFPGVTTAGNLIVVMIVQNISSNTGLPTITGGGVTSWGAPLQDVHDHSGPNDLRADVWGATGVGGSNSITITSYGGTAGQNVYVIAAEFSGPSALAPVSANATGSGATAGVSLTAGFAHSLGIGVMIEGTGSTGTKPSGWSNWSPGHFAYNLDVGPGTVPIDFTGVGAAWVMVGAIFTGAGSPIVMVV